MYNVTWDLSLLVGNVVEADEFQNSANITITIDMDGHWSHWAGEGSGVLTSDPTLAIGNYQAVAHAFITATIGGSTRQSNPADAVHNFSVQ